MSNIIINYFNLVLRAVLIDFATIKRLSVCSCHKQTYIPSNTEHCSQLSQSVDGSTRPALYLTKG